jgi:heat shock protein HtpX
MRSAFSPSVSLVKPLFSHSGRTIRTSDNWIGGSTNGGQATPKHARILGEGVASNKGWKEYFMGNTFKTAFLLTALTLLLMMIGRAFGGQNGMMIALAVALVMNFVSYFFSDKIALSMYRAKPVTREELPRAYQIVERLTQKIGLPMPKIYVIPTESPNAFATGRNPQHASVAVTHGILGLLTDEELEGVLAHELGHVNNRDILISSVAATIAGAITMLASMGRWAMIFGGMEGGDRDRRGGGGGLAALLMLIVAPIAASLIQLAVSRSREYQADATGAHFTGNPYALASALQKLDAYSRRVPMMASPSTAHLFIIQPLLGMNFANLFSTHPPIAKRIERLTGRPAEFQ